jgi:hypothetical protein
MKKNINKNIEIIIKKLVKLNYQFKGEYAYLNMENTVQNYIHHAIDNLQKIKVITTNNKPKN